VAVEHASMVLLAASDIDVIRFRPSGKA